MAHKWKLSKENSSWQGFCNSGYWKRRSSAGGGRRKWDREVAQARYEVFIVGCARNHLKVVLSLDISLLYLLLYWHPSRSSVAGDANVRFAYVGRYSAPLHCNRYLDFVARDVANAPSIIALWNHRSHKQVTTAPTTHAHKYASITFTLSRNTNTYSYVLTSFIL